MPLDSMHCMPVSYTHLDVYKRQSVDNPIWVKFALTQSITINRYQIASANDSPERDPESWKLYGSVDGKVYELIDEQNGIVFNDRFERKTFEIANPKKYQYFRLDIIKNHGEMCIRDRFITTKAHIIIIRFIHLVMVLIMIKLLINLMIKWLAIQGMNIL